MAKILITGVAGFLGSHLAETMLSDGHEVTGVDNLLGGELENVPKECRFYEGDCNNFALMREALEGVDIVYHCAATAYEGLSVFSPHLITSNIVTASTGVFSASIAAGVRRVIFCSSMARYGANPVPFTEDQQPHPQDPYGIGKYASELILQSLADVHDIEWVVAVPHNIIGPRQKYDDPFRNVAAIFINMMLQGRQPYIYGDGSQMRCFSFIDDAIGPLCLMATAPHANREVINIGPDDEFITVSDLAHTIASLLNFKLEAEFTRGRPKEVHLANCSAEKAKRLLGYRPKVRLEEGLLSMIEYMRRRGPRPFNYHLNIEIENSQIPETWGKRLF